MRTKINLSRRRGADMSKITVLALLCLVCGCADSKAGKKTGPELPPMRGARYTFTHLNLRKKFFADPEKLIGKIRADGNRYLREVWVNEEKGSQPDSEKIDYQTTGTEPVLHIITMPEPIDLTDAYMIALVIKDEEPRYFVLEKTITYMNSDNALLCEWTKRGKHMNYGLTTTEPSVENFVEVIKHILAKGY
jgi:hypothetical protein